MKITEILRQAAKELENISRSPQLDARVLLCDVLGKESIYLITHGSDELDAEHEKKFREMTDLRRNNMPVAYITKKKEFMSMEFFVDERVLIPRGDTEILVEKAIEIIGAKNYNVLDMCCGSGCIGLSVKKYAKNICLTLADISEGACEVTQINKNTHFPGNEQIVIIKSDLFENITGKYDVILSNPPYISFDDMKELSKDILNYEPHLALEAEDNGLYFYEKITRHSHEYLKRGGYLIFEIGYDQAEDVTKILSENNFDDIEILQDLAGLDRVVLGRKI